MRSIDQAAAREARNEYMRQYMKKYRKQHPDKVRAIQVRYWANKAQEMTTGPQPDSGAEE